MSARAQNAELEEARCNTLGTAGEISDFLAERLNELHGCNYSFRFWRIVLYKYALTAHRQREFLASGDHGFSRSTYPANTFFLKFHMRRYSFTIRLLRNIKFRQTRRKFNRFLRANEEISVGSDNYFDSVNKTSRLPFWDPRLLGRARKEKFRKLSQMSVREGDPFRKNILELLPRSYVEYFEYLIGLIEIHVPQQKTLRVLSHDPGFESFVIAKYAEAGARFHWYQHGGFYGELAGHETHQHESDVADEFHTWGWKAGPKDVPDRAFKLEEFVERYRAAKPKRKFKILFVLPLGTPRYSPFYEKVVPQLIDGLARTGVKEGEMMVRPRSRYSLLGRSSDIGFMKEFGCAISRPGADIADDIKASNLVILLHYPSTTLLECLSVDHPFVAVWKPGLFELSEQSQQFYSFMRENGLFFHEARDVVSHLKEIDLEQWWKNVVCSFRYREFKETFARVRLGSVKP